MAIREVVEVEAGVEVAVIEVVEVVVEAEGVEVDTALHPGARSGNPQVPTLFLWDRVPVTASHLYCTHTAM